MAEDGYSWDHIPHGNGKLIMAELVLLIVYVGLKEVRTSDLINGSLGYPTYNAIDVGISRLSI